jgi:hypothetical protein
VNKVIAPQKCSSVGKSEKMSKVFFTFLNDLNRTKTRISTFREKINIIPSQDKKGLSRHF